MTTLMLELEKTMYEFGKKPDLILANKDTVFELCAQVSVDYDGDFMEVMPFCKEIIMNFDEKNIIEYKGIRMMRTDDVSRGVFKCF